MAAAWRQRIDAHFLVVFHRLTKRRAGQDEPKTARNQD
jgi:hypothetical protein